MNSSPLLMSVSGVRGIVGRSLTPDILVKLSAAFAQWLNNGGTVVIGRDSRPSGQAIANLTASTLNLAGVNVIDIGIVPTPTVQIMVEKLKADAGLVVTASHNPIEWNAYKFIKKDGTFLSQNEIEILFTYYRDGNFRFMEHSKIGSFSEDYSSYKVHIDAVLDIVDRDKIRSKKFKVLLDSVNGAGSKITPLLLQELGCEVIELYTEMNGVFSRGSEPTPENIHDTGKKVKSHGCQIGFCQDPDADRLALIDENGQALGEESTLSLAIRQKLKKKEGKIVINQSSSRMSEDIAAELGLAVYRASVGEINVVDRMKELKAVIGGEGNGGVIDPDVHLGRDSLVGIALILELMADEAKPISQINAELPSYVIRKEKFPIEKFKDFAEVKRALLPLQEKWHAQIEESDGLRFNLEDQKAWLHIRPSNTEPIIRLIAEAPETEALDNLLKQAQEILKA